MMASTFEFSPSPSQLNGFTGSASRVDKNLHKHRKIAFIQLRPSESRQAWEDLTAKFIYTRPETLYDPAGERAV
jgi:hypothetical protein